MSMRNEFIDLYTQYLKEKLDDAYIELDDVDKFEKDCFESANKVFDFLNENYSYIRLNTETPCSNLREFVFRHFGNMHNLIEYILSEQQSYAVSSIEAWDIFGSNIAISTGYRHAYITILGSPISEKNIIIEWAGTETNENLQKRVNSKFQSDVPGVVILALIAADNKLKSTNDYTVDKYIPFVNDCHTYVSHVQETMNQMLPETLKQKILTLPCHVAPDKPLEECATTKEQIYKQNIENYSDRIRSNRMLDEPALTQFSFLQKKVKRLFKNEEEYLKQPRQPSKKKNK